MVQKSLEKSILDGQLEFKQLERDRGFLVHITMTYLTVNPYLKGLHHYIDSWRPNRDLDGWKMEAKSYIAHLAIIKDDKVKERMSNSHHIRHPQQVNYVKRLVPDMNALEKFFDQKEPTKVNI